MNSLPFITYLRVKPTLEYYLYALHCSKTRWVSCLSRLARSRFGIQPVEFANVAGHWRVSKEGKALQHSVRPINFENVNARS